MFFKKISIVIALGLLVSACLAMFVGSEHLANRGLSSVKEQQSENTDADELSASLEKYAYELNRDRYRHGYLITPPRGKISANIKLAQKEIERVIRYVGGDELEKADIKLVVNIYSSKNPNAWVREFDEYTTGQSQWPSGEWPLQDQLGVSENGRPVVEIAVTTGLLKLLTYEDELASVLSHEITHLLEEHTRHKDLAASQQHEVVADTQGLKRLIGKYNLSASVSALEKLFEADEDELYEKDQSAALKLGLGLAESHHHEGQRISILQFLVEKIRRGPDAPQRRELTPIAKILKINTKFRPSKNSVEDERFELKVAEYWRALDEYFLKDKVYHRVIGTQYSDSNPDLGHYNTVVSPTREQVRAFAMDYLNKVKSADVSKSIKVNSFLQMMKLFKRIDPFQAGFWESMTSIQLNQITRFFIQNSSGENGWKADSFKKITDQFHHHEIQYLIGLFLSDKNGQKVLMRLMSISEQWQLHFQDLFNINRFVDSKGRINFQGLSSNIEYIKRVKTEELESIYYKELNDFSNQLISINPEAFVNTIESSEEDTRNYFSLKAEINRLHRSDEAKNKILSKAKNYLDTRVQPLYLEKIIPKAEGLIFNPSASYIDKVGAYNTYINGSASFESLSSAQLSRLQLIIVDMAKSFEFSDSYTHMYTGDEYVYLVSTVLADKRVSLKDRVRVFEWLSMSKKVEKNILENPNKKVKDNLKQFFSEFSMSELVSLLTSYPGVVEEGRRLYSVIIDTETDADRRAAEGELFKTDNNDEFLKADFSKYLEFKRLFLQSNLNMLKMLSYSNDGNSRIASMKKNEFVRVLDLIERTRSEMIHMDGMGHHANLKMVKHRGSSSILVNLFINSFDEINTFKEWKSFYKRLEFQVGDTFSWSLEQNKIIEKKLMALIAEFKIGSQYLAVKEPSIRKFLSDESIAKIAAQKALSLAKGTRKPETLKASIDKIDKELSFKDTMRDAYSLFKDMIAKARKLQPGNIFDIFSEDERSITEQTSSDSFNVRAMSGLLSITRPQPYASQLRLIEFLMGRSNSMPEFVALTDKSLLEGDGGMVGSAYRASGKSFSIEVNKLRQELALRTELERAVFVNSFFAGPSGLFQIKDSRQLLINKILEPVDQKNKEIARVLVESLIEAEGKQASVFLSYVFAQKNSGEPLTQSLVLKSLLDSYGVPGVKLAQYLAFTNEFKEFGGLLESYQDEAMPISYYQMLLLVNERLGEKWSSEKYKIIKIKGSGSVNIAVEYLNKETQKKDVLNISRQDIEAKTAEDFYRFELLLNKLSKSSSNKNGKFDFVVGLMQVIKKSVGLEFDKTHAFDMQKSVQSIYNKSVNGWRVKTVDAYEVVDESMSILMEKAQGVGARKVLKKSPHIYNEAMAALLSVEMEVLRGVSGSGNMKPVPLFANPDLHDGQVLIDTKSKTVTILDFGQVEEISNQERLLAIDVLRVISGAETSKSSIKLLAKRLKGLYSGFKISEESMSRVLEKSDRMDRFVRLTSLLSRKGFELPLSTVHWVLAANRAIKLGDKIGVPYEKTFRNIAITQKLGIPLSVYNIGENITKKYNEARKRSIAPQCRKALGGF